MAHGKDSPALGKMMADRRFWPLFWTQALGAFNDNVFKNGIVMLITFKSATLAGLSAEKLVALCGGIFILPFFLFSTLAGEIADQRSKSMLARFTKVWEILVMLLGAAGFTFDSLPLLLVALFMLGTQATFFGPIKYSLLPELLGPRELVAGNALIELGTFVSILLGTLLGGILMGLGETGRHWVSGTAIAIAVLGYATSRGILHRDARAPALRISRNPVTPMIELFRLARKVESVFLSILAISWFWLLGSVVLSVLPTLCKDTLGGSEHVLTFFLALFSLGVGFGSLLCERLSFGSLELGLVPVGSIGMTIFALDIGFLPMPSAPTISALFQDPHGWRLAIDMFLFAISGGLFTVPLYTLMQLRTDERERSRVVAANNVLNALLMVGGAVALMGLYAAGLKAPQIFLVLAGANALVAVYVYTVLPEFLFRFVAWVLTRAMYRARVTGAEHFPETGAAVVVCNHVSFIDWLIISSACPRPIRFVMHYSFMKIPVLGLFFRRAKVIPIAGQKEDPAMLEESFRKIDAELKSGELVCIFPEGEITRDGNMVPFRRGVERILAENPVPVVPAALDGMWGSFFSRRHGKAMSKPFRRFWSRIDLRVAPAIPANEATAERLQIAVAGLLGVPVPKSEPKKS
ncbi:MAG: MFS transporter [Bdellovibrionales bacterium]|nr:MFS transporter [Bdellovibrionales bacterium]